MPGHDGFAAALAQSLAATPADQALSGNDVGKVSAQSGAAEPSAHSQKHSEAEAAPNALTLLENALAGVLAAGSAASMATSAAAAAAGASSQSGQSAGAPNGPAAAGAQLIQTLAADAKASASTAALASGPAGGPPGAAAPSVNVATAAATAGAASAVTAALTSAQMASAHVASQQEASDSKSMTLSSPVGSSAWTDELGTKVTWMAHQGIESASLQLSPEHLGPLQVSISVHNGQASVWFGATQPDTRTALQQSLPQLRQLFANQGLTLADAGVSRESPRGQGHQTPTRNAAAVSAVAAASLDSSPARGQIAGGLGLVDTYA